MNYRNIGNNRFIGGGGFFGPFILGGITGSLLTKPNNNNGYYYPYPYYPYNPYYPYPYSYQNNQYYY